MTISNGVTVNIYKIKVGMRRKVFNGYVPYRLSFMKKELITRHKITLTLIAEIGPMSVFAFAHCHMFKGSRLRD